MKIYTDVKDGLITEVKVYLECSELAKRLRKSLNAEDLLVRNDAVVKIAHHESQTDTVISKNPDSVALLKAIEIVEAALIRRGEGIS